MFRFNNGKVFQIPLPTRDRILAVLEEDNKELWVVQARGTVHFYNNYTLTKSFSLKESSAIFYSASIVRCSSTSKIEIAFGTIFSGILIAQINDSCTHIDSKYNIDGHKGTIFGLKHHPQDTNILLSCSDDRSVRIWKRDSNNDIFKQFSMYSDHEARVWAIDICQDKIASCSEDNTCIIWDIKHGRLVKRIENDSNSKGIWTVSFNDTGDKVAIGSNDGSVIIHDTHCDNIKQYHSDYDILLKNFVVTPQGDVYLIKEEEELICLTKFKKVSFTFKIDGLKKFPAMTIASNILFLADDFGYVYVKDVKVVGSEVIKLDFKLPNKITRIFTQQSDCFVMETVNNEVYIYNKREIKPVSIDKKYKMTSFYASSSGEYFIGTRQGILLVFDETLQLIKEIKISDNESLKSIKITNELVHVLDRLGNEWTFKHFDTIESRKSVSKGMVEEYLGDKFVGSFYRQHFIINDLEVGSLVEKVFCGGGHRLWSSAYSEEDAEFSFAYTSNGKLNLVQGNLKGAEIVSIKSHGKEIRCSHESNNSNMVLSGSEDGLVVLYKGLKVISKTRLTNTSIKCIASSSQKYFIGGSNETIEVYELDEADKFIHRASCPKQIKDLETRILCIDVSELGQSGHLLVLVGYSDSSIRIFDYFNDRFELLNELKNVHFNRCVQQLRVIECDSNNCEFITAGADGYICSWTFRLIDRSISGNWSASIHNSGINSLDLKFSGNCFKILTGGEDGNVALTEIVNGKVKRTIKRRSHNSTVTGVKFLDDFLLSASIDRYILICDSENQNIKQVKRTVISDISSASLQENHFTVYGSGVETFKLEPFEI